MKNVRLTLPARAYGVGSRRQYLRSKLNRLGYALDVRGPAFIFVIDARADSPTYGERLAGAFGNEAGAERWIDARMKCRMTGPVSHACDACGGTGHQSQAFDPVWPFKDAKPCPVCRGAGRLPDSMPVADAVADAETLQTVGPRIIGREPFNEVEAVRFARAAFRAVPGLRELGRVAGAVEQREGETRSREGGGR